MKFLVGAVVSAVFLLGCGDGGTTSTQLTCINSGPGTQQCIDGNGNVTDSPCTTVNGALVTTTGQACDASTTTTTNEGEPAG